MSRSGIPTHEIERIRGEVYNVLQTMRGFLSVWNYSLQNVKKENNQIRVTGTFSDDYSGTRRHTFTITMDAWHNVVSVDIV